MLLRLVPPGFSVVIMLDWGWQSPAPIDRGPFSQFVIHFPSVKAHSFQLGALSSSKHFSCTWWEKTWLCTVYCITYVANISIDACVSWVFGELTYLCHSWQYPFILSLGDLRKSMVPAFQKFYTAAGNSFCFIFSNQDGLFVISCSLEDLFQIAKMPMPHVASGRGGVLLCW